MSVLKTFLVLSLLALCVSCATYYVSPFGNDNNSGTSTSSPLRTIAKGISKASYGEVFLMSGVYAGTGNSGLYLSSTVNINAQPNVIVTCQQTANQYAFSFSSSSSSTFTVANFTIRDCKTAFSLPTSSYTRTLVAQNLHITNVDLAFDTQYTNLTLDNVQINTVNKGIRLSGGRSYLTIRNSVFQNITENAVFANSCYDAIKVINTTFSQGKSSAINTACDLSVLNGTFSSNSAINGSAISANSSTTIQVTNSTFGFNFASSNGGAIRAADRTSLAILGSTFDGNAAANGGAVSTEGTMNIALTQFYGNKASISGGGFFCKNGQNLLTNVKFIYNSAPAGQAFNCDGCATYGSDIILTGNTGDCPITKSLISNDRPVTLTN